MAQCSSHCCVPILVACQRGSAEVAQPTSHSTHTPACFTWGASLRAPTTDPRRPPSGTCSGSCRSSAAATSSASSAAPLPPLPPPCASGWRPVLPLRTNNACAHGPWSTRAPAAAVAADGVAGTDDAGGCGATAAPLDSDSVWLPVQDWRRARAAAEGPLTPRRPPCGSRWDSGTSSTSDPLPPHCSASSAAFIRGSAAARPALRMAAARPLKRPDGGGYIVGCWSRRAAVLPLSDDGGGGLAVSVAGGYDGGTGWRLCPVDVGPLAC